MIASTSTPLSPLRSATTNGRVQPRPLDAADQIRARHLVEDFLDDLDRFDRAALAAELAIAFTSSAIMFTLRSKSR